MNTPLDELPLPKYKKQTDVLKKQKEELRFRASIILKII